MTSTRSLNTRDRPEQPSIGDFVAVSFSHPDWGEVASRYSADVRPVPVDGDRWIFDLTAKNPALVELSFEGIEDAPYDYGVWLIDETAATRQDLRMGPQRLSVVAPRSHTRIGAAGRRRSRGGLGWAG